MKSRLLFIALSLSSSFCGFAQNPVDVKGPPEIFVQLGNTSNTYYNTITTSNVGTGALNDSTTQAVAIYLQTVNYAIGLNSYKLNGVLIPKVATDTLFPMTLSGDGRISLHAKCLKVSGTDTVVLTPVESIDGVAWYAITGLSAVTLNPTSLTVPLSVDWDVNTGYFPIVRSNLHYGLKVQGGWSNSTSVKAWIDYYLTSWKK